MNLNADFSERVVMHGAKLNWQDTPMPGVRRRMLDRIGNEVARATTIVSYEPASQFSAHVHPGGEEFVVLAGVFEDEHGSYPAGSYVRNPPQSRHTPGSTPGCVMLVKLWQFDPADRQHIRMNFDKMQAQADALRPGVTVISLYADEHEQVRIEQWAPNTRASIDTSGGAEIFVLNGSLTENQGESQSQSEAQLQTHSWLRVPLGAQSAGRAGPGGTRIWIKNGHLSDVHAPGD